MAEIFDDPWKTNYAKKLYDKCIDIFNQRLKTEPENIECLENLSNVYNNCAILQEGPLNNYESVEKYYNKAIEIDKRIIKISTTPKYQNSLSRHYNNLALLQDLNMNNPKSAEINYKKSIEILEKITETSDDTEYIYGLVITYCNLANLQQRSLNDYNSAETHYNQAIKRGEQIRKYSDNPKYLNKLSATYHYLAVLQTKQERYESAIKVCKKAIDIKDNIKDTNITYLVSWMYSITLLADLYIATDKLTEARAIVDEIKPRTDKLLKEYPNYDYLKYIDLNYGYLKDINDWIKETESMLNKVTAPSPLPNC